jgi:ElaB/YqjD/DUF883 family membrane-anchored ribosome-binding protein
MSENDMNRTPETPSGSDPLHSRPGQGGHGSGLAGPANTPSFGDRPAGGSTVSGAGYGSPTPSRTGDAPGDEGERMDGMRNRVEEQLDSGMRSAADRMEGIAQRLDEVADERMAGEGVRGKAGNVAHKVADRIEGTAGYLRENDAHQMIGRLENQVRERPLEMLLAGVAAGWLVGKILR